MAQRLVPAAPGLGQRLLITGMDIYSLPDALKEAWHIIIGR